MIDLQDKLQVAELQRCMTIFESAEGKHVLEYLEQVCGWYRSTFQAEEHPQLPLTLINDGKRQVLATIKTLLSCTPEQIVSLATEKENV